MTALMAPVADIFSVAGIAVLILALIGLVGTAMDRRHITHYRLRSGR